MKHVIVLVGLVVAVLASAAPARAECSVVGSKIVFPPYDVYSTTPLDAVGELQYKCSPDQKDTTPNIRIVFGPSADGGFVRGMSFGGDTLKYNVYIDPLRTTVWGDGSVGTIAYSAACCAVGKFAILNMYGRIPPGQDVKAGSYVDSLLMSIEF
jgi:spore coat protein U-like protein